VVDFITHLQLSRKIVGNIERELFKPYHCEVYSGFGT
jgi:hypothetical protein